MSAFFDPEAPIEKRRHNLPHWQQEHVWIFLTWRLADSLPKTVLTQWKEERDAWLGRHPEPSDPAPEIEYHRRFSDRINDALDVGHGNCCLRDSALREIVAGALRHFDGQRYVLAGFVVMPNHVHVLFRPLGDHQLPDIAHTWKRFTARAKATRQEGALWQADYWDRLIRSKDHFDWVMRYLEKNPGNFPAESFTLWRAGL